MFRNLLYKLLGPLVIPQKETIGCSTCFSAVRGSSKAHCHQFVFKSTSAWARMHMRPVLRYLNLASAVGNTNLWNLQMYFQEMLSMFFNKGGSGHKALTGENYHLIWGKNLLAKIDTILEGHCCGNGKAACLGIVQCSRVSQSTALYSIPYHNVLCLLLVLVLVLMPPLHSVAAQTLQYQCSW